MSKKPKNHDYYDDDDQDQFDESTKAKKKEHPRFIKNDIDKVNPEEIVVNLSKTHYDIIQLVVEELGWVVQHSRKSQKWDILWTDNHIDAQDLFKLNDQQKISHFPAISVLANKNNLGKSLMKMGKAFPEQYNYFPPTWSIPSQIGQLMRYDSQLSEQQKPIYIFKPQASSQGKGIVLLSKIQQLQGKFGIVQLYVNNPLLIDHLKFDMRIYVLIYGCDPLRIYVYEQGLARFATETYEKAKKKNLKDNFIHLTNYAINKTNKKFIFNTSEHNMNVGHKRSLTSIFNLLKNRGFNVDEIKKKINQIIVKTLLVGKPMLQHIYGLSQTDNLSNDHCFQILGFDVMLNEHLDPILLEVNHTPSFVTDTPLDKTIKKNLIKETLLLLNVNVNTKKTKIQRKRQFNEKRFEGKLTKLSNQQRMQQKVFVQAQKDNHEAVTLKKYKKLYPTDSTEYLQIEQFAKKIFNQQYGFKNKQLPQTVKHPASIRPISFENIPTIKKLKDKKVENRTPSYTPSPSNVSSPTSDDIIKKLPEISPKKSSLFKLSTIGPTSKHVLKNYQFSPEKIFSCITDKISHQKLRYKQHQADLASIFVDRQKFNDTFKKDGAFIEPKLIKLTEIGTKNLLLLDEIAHQYSLKLQTKQKPSHKNFMDFVSESNRGKSLIPNFQNSLIYTKKQQKKRDYQGKNGKLKSNQLLALQQNAQDILLMKSMTLTKHKVGQ